jgi:hypothetical protein
MRAIATLYDSQLASFFGSQCISPPVLFDTNASLPEQVLQFDFDVFWHSNHVNPDAFMILQLTMASRADSGVLINEYCIGWCKLHLATVRAFGWPHMANAILSACNGYIV